MIDILPQVDYLLGERAPLQAASFEHKSLAAEDCRRILDHALRQFDTLDRWQRDALYTALRTLADAMDIKMRDFLPPLFVAVSGRAIALPLFDSLAYLGRDLTRTRLRSAIEVLGGVSKKEAKRLERSLSRLGFDRDLKWPGSGRSMRPAQTRGAIAQLGERYNGIVEVAGSIPAGSTNSTISRRSAAPEMVDRGKRPAHPRQDRCPTLAQPATQSSRFPRTRADARCRRPSSRN